MIKRIGSDFFYKESSDNTLAWAKEYLDTAQDGAVFIAHKLTHARGRQGRTWHWAPGQLALTFVLKPTFCPNEDDLIKLSMALACGIYEPLTQYGVTLKWPNDLVIDQKKVGGMLMELVWESNKLRGIIFAFGLNVNNTFEPGHELTKLATSLWEATPPPTLQLFDPSRHPAFALPATADSSGQAGEKKAAVKQLLESSSSQKIYHVENCETPQTPPVLPDSSASSKLKAFPACPEEPDEALQRQASRRVEGPITHEPFNIPALQETILTSLDSWYQAWYSRSYDHIFATWVAAQSCLGKEIKVHKKDGSTITGIAHHLLPNGTLSLLVDNQEMLLSFHDVDFLTI
ncbi:biotin--[acetyl-CoA-carboxylase] ligase [Candidatus Babeliales bacterium]|nr:biotin--[acetyl-CoA-carboxylase] ligase [Candidatus Babeliales bacterium]